MSALVDRDIRRAIDHRKIVITPFDEKALGTNSYDIHLAPTLRTYADEFDGYYRPIAMDVRKPRETREHKISDAGFVLQPGDLYLASTLEYTESHEHLPILNGRSSVGRLGLSIHVTAGTGDVGFCGFWTMELFVVGKPLRVYAGMPIGQLLWFSISGMPDTPYNCKASAKYNNSDPLPQTSKLHQEP